MPAPLTEARKREIARVVASSPTMAGAAVALGYKNRNVLSVTLARNRDIATLVAQLRQKAGRSTWGVDAG